MVDTKEAEDHHVLDELQRGYKLKDRACCVLPWCGSHVTPSTEAQVKCLQRELKGFRERPF